jgi:tRNA A-37 threonylcarbamoyl transferase component Bud32
MGIGRRRFVSLTATGLVSSCAVSAEVGAQASSSTDGWPAPQVDKQNTSYIDRNGPISRLKDGWKDVRSGSVGTPVVSDGTVYAADGSRLRAYDTEDGSTVWSLELDGSADASPMVHDGEVYVTGGSETYVVDADTGEVSWRHSGRGGGSDTPKASGDTVYVPKGGSLQAVSVHTKRAEWTTGSRNITPALDGDRVYSVSSGGVPQSIRAEDGVVEWRGSIDGSVNVSPVVVGGNPFFVTSRGDGAMFRPSGERFWEVSLGSGVSLPPAVDDEHIYVPTDDGTLHALRYDQEYRSSRQVSWTFETDRGELSAPAVAGNAVYVGVDSSPYDGDSVLYVLDSSDGRVVAEHETFSAWSPAVAGDSLYFGKYRLQAVRGEVAPVNASVRVVDAELNQPEISRGQEYSANVSLRNDGTVPGEIEVEMARDGSTDSPQRTFTVEADETHSVSITSLTSVLDEGEYDISVNGVSAGTLVVEGSASGASPPETDSVATQESGGSVQETRDGGETNASGGSVDGTSGAGTSEEDSAFPSLGAITELDVQQIRNSETGTLAGAGAALAATVFGAGYLVRRRRRGGAEEEVDRRPQEIVEMLTEGEQSSMSEASDDLITLAKEEPESLKEYEDELLRLLQVNNNWVKRRVILALGKVGSERCISRLEEIDMFEAEQAIELIRKRHRGERQHDTEIPEMIEEEKERGGEELEEDIEKAETSGGGETGTETGGSVASDIDAEYDEFERLELLGSGGSADVHRSRVRTKEGETVVALKTPRMSNYETVDTAFFKEFTEEAEIWNSIDGHENIVGVLDWGRKPHPWIALEYMNDGNLRQKDLSTWRAAEVLTDVASATHHAHRHGIAHTDLKPENILFNTDGDGSRRVKVADWGLARVLLDHSESVKGLTTNYSAPEQVDPVEYGGVDDRTDIYQTAAIAYEQFTGRPVFDYDSNAAVLNAIINKKPKPPSELNKELPAEVDDVLLKALSKDKADRQASVLYLRDEIQNAFGI